MTSRERVLCALAHREPDRVPIFFGATGATTMNVLAYDRLKTHLGISGPSRAFWRALQYALLDEEVMIRFGSDARPLVPGPAPSRLAREISDDRFIDAWGIAWQRQPGNHYFDMASHPLADACIEDIERYPWPELSHPSRFTGLRARAQAIQDAGYAVFAHSGVMPFESAQMLRGMDNWLCDLGDNRDFVHALMRKLTELQLESTLKLIEEVGPHIDLINIADDLGTQKSPLISPSMYRRLVKPYHVELVREIKARTRAAVFLHSCGDVYPLIEDLIEVGIDVLNPIHVSAADMGDTARLKRQFGDRLCFCGGIDTQHVLPHGSTDDVRREVRRRIADLAPGGGYFLASVHCIQPDVPPQNVVAMFEEAMSAGRYPLQVVPAPLGAQPKETA